MTYSKPKPRYSKQKAVSQRLEAVLAKWGRSGLLTETLAVLHSIEVHHDVMQTVQAIHRSGIRCHIASNQQTLRAKLFSENYPSATLAATATFVVLWLALTGFNMWTGVSKAGYSVADELPVLLLLFGVPAIAAIVLKWKFF